MIPAPKGKSPKLRESSHADALAAEPRHQEHAPQSSFYSRRAPESSLVELAIQLNHELTVPAAIALAVSTLSSLLPECVVAVRDAETHDDRDRNAEQETHWEWAEATTRSKQFTNHGPGRCEWRLSEGPSGLCLVVELGQTRRPRELAHILDLGEQVAALLGGAIRHESLRCRLLSQSEQILELRRRVIQAEKLASYGQLVASIVHDLNNPLTAILAYSEYLGRSLRSVDVPDADLDRLARIREAADTVLRNTRGLVDYARPSQSLSCAVNLESVIQRALGLCEHEFTRTGLQTRMRCTTALPAVLGHAEQLTQLFVNLFTNAAHAARPERAELSIEAFVEVGAESITIRVEDNGAGIQSADIEHIFEPFFTTKGGSGSGLGLSIVRDILLQHGGNVSVFSVPFVGTTFTLSLPLIRSS